MKRFVAILLSVLMSCTVLFSATACAKKNPNSNTSSGLGDETVTQPSNPPPITPDIDIPDIGGDLGGDDSDVTDPVVPDPPAPPPPPTEDEPETPDVPPAPPVEVPDAPEEELPPPPDLGDVDVPEEGGDVNLGDLVGDLIALPDYTVTRNPSAGSIQGAIQIGTQEFPTWIIPSDNWVDSEKEYECNDPEHIQHFLKMETSFPSFVLSINALDQLIARILADTAATDNNGAPVEVKIANIDGVNLAEVNVLTLTAGTHTALLMAKGAHGRKVVATREFTVASAPVLSAPADPVVVRLNSSMPDVWAGVTVATYNGIMTKTDNAEIIDTATPGYYNVILTVTDDLGETKKLVRRVAVGGADIEGADKYLHAVVGTDHEIDVWDGIVVKENGVVLNANQYTVSADVSVIDRGAEGVYAVKLTVTNNLNITTTATRLVYVHRQISISVIGGNLHRMINTDDEINIWEGVVVDAYNGKYSSTDTLSQVKRDTEGSYTITLTVTDCFGETAETVRTVEIHSDPQLSVTGGDLDALAGSSPDDVKAWVDTYVVAFDNVFTKYVDFSKVNFNTSGVYPVTLRITDKFGKTASAQRAIIIHAAPVINVPGDITRLVYATDPLDIWAGVTYSTYDGQGDVVRDELPAISFDKDGVYAVQLSVTDRFGVTTTTARTVIVRPYSQEDALAVYNDMQTALMKQEWTWSATAAYQMKISASYQNGSLRGPMNTHIFAQNTADTFFVGFAIDSNWNKSIGANLVRSYASTIDGAVTFEFNRRTGAVVTKRTNYDGGYAVGTCGDADKAPTNNPLQNFDSSNKASFTNACTTLDTSAVNLASVLSNYGIDLTKFSLNDVNANTLNDPNAFSVSLNNNRLVVDFTTKSGADKTFAKLIAKVLPPPSEKMTCSIFVAKKINRWSVTGCDVAKVSYTVDRETKIPVNFTAPYESYSVQIKADDQDGSNLTSHTSDSSQGYSYGANFAYANPSVLKTSYSLSSSNRISNVSRMSSNVAMSPSSSVHADGSCSCAGSDRYTDVGHVGDNAPAVPAVNKLNIPYGANNFTNWLYLNVNTTERFAPAAIRVTGESEWTKITADTDWARYSEVGTYDVKYIIYLDEDNYSYFNREVEVAPMSFDVGSYVYDESAPEVADPTLSALEIPAVEGVTAEVFRKLLNKGVSIPDASVSLLSITDSNGTVTTFDSAFDVEPFIQGAGTYTVKYYAVQGANYRVFSRMLNVTSAFQLDDECDIIVTEGTLAPQKSVNPTAFALGDSNTTIWSRLYNGVTVTADNGATLTAIPVGIRKMGETAFKRVKNASTFDYASVMNAVDTYEVRYYAKDSATGNFTYFLRPVQVIGESGSGILSQGTVAPEVKFNELGFNYNNSSANLYAWLFDGATATAQDGSAINAFPIGIRKTGETAFTAVDKNTDYSAIFGATGTYEVRYRATDSATGNFTYAVRTVTACDPAISVSLVGQPTVTSDGKEYVAYNALGQSDDERARILTGVTVSDGGTSVTLDNVSIEGMIDYTKPGQYHSVKLTLTNKFGVSVSVTRHFYVNFVNPSLVIDNSGMETMESSGKTLIVFRYNAVPDLKTGVTVKNAEASALTVEGALDTTLGKVTAVKYSVSSPYGSAPAVGVRYYYCRDYYVDEYGSNAITIYGKMEEVMNQQTYFMKGIGQSAANAPIVGTNYLTIYTTIDHKPNEVFIENLSDGKAIVGNCTSYGKRVYLKQNGSSWSGSFGEVKDQGNTSPIINKDWSYSYNNNWGGGASAFTDGGFKDKFGRPLSQLFGYPIKSTTVDASSFNKSGENYILSYTLKTDGEAVEGYKKQVNTMSGQTVDKMERASVITVTIDKSFRILNYKVSEKYKVTTMGATTDNNIEYRYFYMDPNSFNVRKF